MRLQLYQQFTVIVMCVIKVERQRNKPLSGALIIYTMVVVIPELLDHGQGVVEGKMQWISPSQSSFHHRHRHRLLYDEAN